MLFNDHSPGPAVSDTVTLQVKGPEHEPYNIFIGDNENNLVESSYSPSPISSVVEAPSELEKVEDEVVRTFNQPVESHDSPTFTPSQSNNLEDIDRDLFDLIGEFIDRNSNSLLILAVIVTLCIVVFLYTKSSKQEFFKVI